MIEESQIHSRILEGDDIALTALYDLVGGFLVDELKKKYASIAYKDEALVLEAVNEALLGYYLNPSTYDPERGPLKKFLKVAADRDLQNIISREKRHSGKIELPEDVELQENMWNINIGNSQSSDIAIIEAETIKAVDELLNNYFNNNTDITIARMILQNVRETKLYSEVLEIESLTIEEQKTKVKQNKDRIKKVLERNQVVEKIKELLC